MSIWDGFGTALGNISIFQTGLTFVWMVVSFGLARFLSKNVGQLLVWFFTFMGVFAIIFRQGVVLYVGLLVAVIVVFLGLLWWKHG